MHMRMSIDMGMDTNTNNRTEPNTGTTNIANAAMDGLDDNEERLLMKMADLDEAQEVAMRNEFESAEELEELLVSIFKEFDKDNNGYLDPQEFRSLMETAALGHAVQYQPQLTASPFIDIMINSTGPPTNMSMRFRWEFDDPRSIRAKATIMREAKVGGVGMWTADALDYNNASRSTAMWWALLGQPTAVEVDTLRYGNRR